MTWGLLLLGLWSACGGAPVGPDGNLGSDVAQRDAQAETDTGPGPDTETDTEAHTDTGVEEPLCQDPCSVEEASCSEDATAVRTCREDEQGCLVESIEPCAEGLSCRQGQCLPCAGPTGTFFKQTLESQGDQRVYLLHVPDSYECQDAWPLLVDLHGTATSVPEEAYGLSAAMETADASRFLLLRPRSRSSVEGGTEIFRWDQNPGDPDRNRQFIEELVGLVQSQYHVDPDRIYVMGFSSGTNQTAVLAADPGAPFSGYGFIGGGAWTVSSGFDQGARYYFSTGYRDYMKTNLDPLLDHLRAEGVEDDQLLIRETNAGHDLYAWMYPELWTFLDQGIRPDPGTLAPAWQLEDLGGDEALVAVSQSPSGSVVAVGQDEAIYARSPEGTWTPLTPSGSSPLTGRDLTGLCFTPSGLGLAVGGGQVLLSQDGGGSWVRRAAIPDFGQIGFGFGYANDVACRDGRLVAAGYWMGAASADGQLWTSIDVKNYGYSAQVASLAVAPWGTWISTGYYFYAGRSEDGAIFTTVALPGEADWVLGATPLPQPGAWVLVGDRGHIWRSTDDAVSFALVHSDGPDLYAVGADDQGRTLAVGWGGAALLSLDAGQTWRSCPNGLSGFLGDLTWLPDGRALVVGQDGAFLLNPEDC